MPRRMILTDAERQNFLALPTDDDTLIRHWSLDDDDRRLIGTRRHDDTRLGLALQLCALRYPGRLIQRKEVIPAMALSFLAEQLGIDPEALVNFARRAPTPMWDEIERQVERLRDFPHSGRAGRMPETRELVVSGTPFIVVYLVSNNVELIRVLHGAQQWPMAE